MFILACVTALLVANCGAQCIDGEGNEVDWFVMLKMNDGYDYLYADELTVRLKEEEELDVRFPENPVGRVLERVYENSSWNYILYNDQPPEGPVSNRGHTKGILTWDDEYVTWILHSVPGYPPKKAHGYSYPSTAEKNGQSFMCLSFGIEQLDATMNQLYYTWPQIYDQQVAEKFKQIPKMIPVLNGQHVKEAPWKSITILKTRGQIPFTSFAKSAEFGDDLYKALVGPYFQESLYTETWQNGRGGKLPSNCIGDLFVKNIVIMNILGNYYQSSQDHSKWSISTTKSGSLLCVGDLNRVSSQFKRDGGTMCFKNEKLWSQLIASVLEVEDCESF